MKLESANQTKNLGNDEVPSTSGQTSRDSPSVRDSIGFRIEAVMKEQTKRQLKKHPAPKSILKEPVRDDAINDIQNCPNARPKKTKKEVVLPPETRTNCFGVKSKTKAGGRRKSSRDLLIEMENLDIEDNTHRVDIRASFKLKDAPTANFHYSYDPSTLEEAVATDCEKNRLAKLDLAMDKNGNLEASQFIKGLVKMSAKFEGMIEINGYRLMWDKEASRRLKIQDLDIRLNPIVLELATKGIRGVDAHRSNTALEIRGETEFGGEMNKWIRIEGWKATDVKVCSPEGKGRLFVCIPAVNTPVITVDESTSSGKLAT